jgi:hypothetical protein
MKMLGDLGLVEPSLYRPRFEALLAAPERSRDWLLLWPTLAIEAFARWHWDVRSTEKRGTVRA